MDWTADVVSALMAESPFPDRPFGGYTGVGRASLAGGLAAALEESVFVDSFGTTGDEHREAYEPYDAQSLFFVLVDHRSCLPAGAARVVLPGPRRQKTMRDIEAVWGATPAALAAAGFTPGAEPVWDVATLAVDARYRSPLVSQGVHQLICTSAQLAQAGWFVSILDTRVYRLFGRQLRGMFTAFPTLPARLYGGSLSVPCWCDITAYTQRLRHQDPALLELLFWGRGLEGAISPPSAWLQAPRPELVEQSGLGPRRFDPPG